MRTRRSGAANGFTLGELLVVVGLIGVVGTILIPALTHKRTPSRHTYCRDNLKQIHYAISMYEQEFGMFPTRGGKDQNGGDAQEALNLLYREYTDDVRIFSCSGKPLNPAMMNQILPRIPTGWPGAPGTYLQEAPPGVAGTSTSYGYSPGHNSAHSRVVIAADRLGTGANGNSDNHGKSAGQNVLSAGGAVMFSTVRSNALGEDDDKIKVIDSDIFSGKTISPVKYTDWDTYCR